MFQVQQSVKKVMLTAFWNMKGPITINFLEKGATVNSASDSHLLMQNSPYLLNDPYNMEHEGNSDTRKSQSLWNNPQKTEDQWKDWNHSIIEIG